MSYIKYIVRNNKYVYINMKMPASDTNIVKLSKISPTETAVVWGVLNIILFYL